MVKTATNFGRSGLVDWLAQRVSAIILAAYTIYLVGFIVCTPEFSFDAWSNLFSHLWMRIFSLLALVSTIVHGWIGIWGVLTDYVTSRFMGPKATSIRAVILFIYGIVNVAFLVWGVEILWGLNR